MSDDTLTRTKRQVLCRAKLILSFTLLFTACGGGGGVGPHDSGTIPVVMPCSHSPCHAGAPLNYACDPCVQMICGSPTNSCCNLDAGAGVDAGWSSGCVGMVGSYCAQRCDCADAGTPSPTRGFNQYACDCTVTECSSRPSCCVSGMTAPGWDQTCVNQIMSLGYNAGCNPRP